MPNLIKKYKAAAVQAEPGWFNLEESVQKTIHWINEAGAAGCKLVAFPEVCKLPHLDTHTFRIKLNEDSSIPDIPSLR